MKMDILAESAVRITVLALGVALVLRVLQIRSPRLAHGAWAAVVVVMLLLPAFVAWGPELAVPVLSPPAARLVARAAGEAAATEPAALPVIMAPATEGAQRRVTWTAAVVAVYFAGVGFFLLRLGVGLRRAHAIRRSAVRAQGRLTHPDCVTPITIGIVTPVVILPPDFATMDEAEMSAALAHEDEHVRRRDPLVALITVVNRAIFWFHPLAWWLHREIARLSEQACDAFVISRGHDSDIYSACLLRFARRAAGAGGRIAPMATAMPGAGLRVRLGMLGRPPAARPSGVRLAGAAVLCAALVAICGTASPTAAPAQRAASGAPGQITWIVETSEHFEIIHNGLRADQLSDAIRDAEAAYAHLSAALKYEMPRRVLIALVRRERDLEAATRPLDPAQAGQRIVISLESLDQDTGILVHELTHQFAFDIVPGTSRVAPFVIEGLAEHQRGAWKTADLRITRDAVAAGAIPTLATLSNTDRHWAHAVFDFVAARHGAEGVRRILFALRAHETLVQAVPTALGLTLDQVDQEFRNYAMTRFGRA